MANQKQLDILKQGVEVWNKWRQEIWEENLDIEIDLSKAELNGSNLQGAYLSGANLMGAKLKRANLWRVDLSGAALENADLTGANLREAELLTANFTGANLAEAYLVGANLKGAELLGTNLTGTNLTEANLKGANFAHSIMGKTVFGNNDLSSSLGLAKTNPWYFSIIDIDTIRNSKGNIPVEFLRACGFSDLDIEYTRLVIPGLDLEQVTQILYEIHHLYCDQPIQFYSCFISYNSKDHKFAQRLHDDLQNNGVRCWFAPEDMKIGDEFRKTIGQQIRVRDKLLIILSENSIGSEWVGDEVEKALAEEKEQGTLKLFPIRLDNTVFDSKDNWAEKIRLRRHIGDFSSDYDKAFQRLLRDLKQQ